MYQQSGRLSQNLLALIFLLVLASAYITEKIGIHALFGAFLIGRDHAQGNHFRSNADRKDRRLHRRLPSADLLRLHRPEHADRGAQFSPPYGAIRSSLSSSPALANSAVPPSPPASPAWDGANASVIGILMNTRGLMELVILNIGRDLGVITNAVFAMMVIMAVITTALTTPVLHWVHPKAAEGLDEDEEAATGRRRRFTTLVPVSLPTSGPMLAKMASLLVPASENPQKIIALHLRRPRDLNAYRDEMPRAESTTDNALGPLLEAAAEQHIDTDSLSFVSRDVPTILPVSPE